MKYTTEDIPAILDNIYSNPSLRKKIIPLFMGNTGLGKTTMIKDFAREKKVNLVSIIASQRMPYEVSGMAMADKESKKMSIWDFDTLLNLKDGDILLADELFNGIPATLNAMLTLFEEREMISGRKLPDITIVAAANPQGMPPLTPQIRSRFWQYDIEFSSEGWKKYMHNRYRFLNKISINSLCSYIKNEDFTGYNYHTPKDFDKAIEAIIDTELKTPFDDVLLPVLNTKIKNPLDGEVKLSEDKILKKDEKIEWLELIKKLQEWNYY